MSVVIKIVSTTIEYWFCLTSFIYFKQSYSETTYFNNDLHAKVQIFSLSLIFKLWSKPHYRNKSFQQDMIDNLKNVAIPGTGVPLSFFCHLKLLALLFVYFINPFVCFCGALNKSYITAKNGEEMLELLGNYYIEHLLHPTDWFSLWRMNCRLVSYHSFATKSAEYRMEDKWTFLVQGKALGVPISPYYDHVDAIVCKNKLIEGGMGIHFYKNAAFGGDWILQEKLSNAMWLNSLLPPNAPLSTMRIITTSTYSLSEEYPIQKERSMLVATQIQQEVDDVNSPSLPPSLPPSLSSTLSSSLPNPAHSSGEKSSFIARNIGSDSHYTFISEEGGQGGQGSRAGRQGGQGGSSQGPGGKNSHSNLFPIPSSQEKEQVRKYIVAQSAVLRLGRGGASTDHSSILFDVEVDTGLIRDGCSNAHWYQLGLGGALHTPWLPPLEGQEKHPDPPCPLVRGRLVPSMAEAVEIVTTAHYKMMAEVPIVGWDVAFTPQGIFLLEVNLSCNFFRGSFSLPNYLDLLHRFWMHLEKIETLERETQGGAGGQNLPQKYSRGALKKE